MDSQQLPLLQDSPKWLEKFSATQPVLEQKLSQDAEGQESSVSLSVTFDLVQEIWMFCDAEDQYFSVLTIKSVLFNRSPVERGHCGVFAQNIDQLF